MIDEVKIGAICYPVVEVHKLKGVDDDGKAVWCLGRFVYAERRIEIDRDLDLVIRPITLLHEVLHGILQNAGLDDQPEPLVRAIAHGVVQVLRDNPGLVTYLTRGDS